MQERLTDGIILDDYTRVEVSISRQPGMDENGNPYEELRAGNILGRLCPAIGAGACQAPEDYDNSDKLCAARNSSEVFDSLGIPKERIFTAAVCGSANVAFLDASVRDSMLEPENGYKTFTQTDGLFGPVEYAKACRLADCGLLVVSGKDRHGDEFNGFIHATRLNMNGNDQFKDSSGHPVGGVTKMLQEMRDHYRPTELSLDLVAGISLDLYVFDFTPSAADLAKDETVTAEQKREALFKGWHEKGWITPQLKNGAWDGRHWNVDMYAAVEDQVERAGLGDVYSESAMITDGSLESGHASNRAGKHGRVAEARDFYIVAPVEPTEDTTV
jgi:hypothetical protein